MLERDRIYRKDHSENKKLFCDIKTHQKYSLYGTELNRIFGDRSYDQFYKGLLENKKMSINNFKKMFEKPVIKGGIKKIESPFDIKLFTTCLKKMDLKSKQLEYKIKHPHILNPSKYSQEVERKLKILSERFRLPDIPDIGRYNPNYNSVRTHSFYPTFASSDYDYFNTYKKNVYAHNISLVKEPLPEENISKINIKKKPLKNLKNSYLNTDPNISNINNKSILDKSVKSTDYNNMSQMMSTSSFGDEKNNHCLRFDSYSPRKPIVNKLMYDSEVMNNSTNYRLFSNIKGSVDFNKSSNSNTGCYFDEIAKNNNNPPLGMYQPNFDFISKKTVNIFLNKRLPPSPKLALLKKIITCYKTTSEYKTVSGLNEYTQREMEKMEKTK
jgi:hypothetical protein